MSGLVDVASLAMKAISVTRSGRRLGHETPVLDEIHSALTPYRRRLTQERLEQLSQGIVAQPADSDGSNDADGDGAGPDMPAAGDQVGVDGEGTSGVVSDVVGWILDKFDHVL
jgi:hypothetical protein